MKKIINISVWVIFTIGTLVLFSFTEGAKNTGVCKTFEITVDWESGNQFITDDQVKTLINRMGYVENETPMETIDSKQIENKLMDLPSAKEVVVFKDMDGVLIVKIKQRKPIARVFNQNGTSFYMDNEGNMMPLSSNYTARVVVINGALNEKSNWTVEEIKANDSIRELSLLDDIYDFVSTYKKDEFFNAQFEQIYITNNKEFEIIPKVGDQRILFGKPTEVNEKLEKLKIFYTEGINPENLNLYTTINLKFNGQIVCTKK